MRFPSNTDRARSRWRMVFIFLLVACLLALRTPALTARALLNASMLSLADLDAAEADRAARALPLLQFATEWNGSDPRANWNLGLAWKTSGEQARTVEIYKKTPEALSEVVLRGQIAAAHGNWEESLTWFRVALQVHPNSIEALDGAGNAWAALERWDLARADYARALELNPNRAEGYTQYARALMADNHDLASAELLLKRAAQLTPGSEEVYRGLANLAYSRNDAQQALHWWEKAASVAPKGTIDSLLHLGAAYEMVGLNDEAIATYRQAAAEAPNSVSPHLALAKSLLRIGNHGEARIAVTRALKIDPGNSEALRLLTKIDLR